MSDTSGVAILALGTIALVCLFGLLIAAFLGVMFLLVMRRTARVFRHANQALQTDTTAYFADSVPKLLPWQSNGFADLSSQFEMTGIAAIGLHYRGVIRSLSQPNESGWLAYDLRLDWRSRGALILRTSSRAVQLEFRGSPSDTLQVSADGIPLGSLREQSGEIVLRDVLRQQVGRYSRYRRKPFRLRLTTVDVEPGYGAVEIDGRQVAEINHNLIPNQYVSLLNQPVPALLHDLPPALRSQEEDWLLALIALEVYYRIARKISDARLRNK